MAYLLDQVFLNLKIQKNSKAIVQATTHYQDYELIGKLAAELEQP